MIQLITSDNEKCINLGLIEDLDVFLSTIENNIIVNKKEIINALSFLKTGNCEHSLMLEVAKEFNLIRDELSNCSIEKIILANNKIINTKKISPVITSCGNYFITPDGKDEIYEIVSLLTYAYYSNVTISFNEFI